MSEAPRTHVAPGKLVIVGEYAVLDGGPALVLAVNRGVRCDLEPGGASVRIETPDGDDRFVRAALAGAPPGLYRFSHHNPVSRIEGKPGFGGSAAACVVACLAARRDPNDALGLHHAVQGSGSGIDVAAAIHGGMLRVEGSQVQPVNPVRPVVAWSGEPAHTGPRVAAYQAWKETDKKAHSQFLAQSASIVNRFEENPVEALRAAGATLEAMATAAGIPYLTPALVRIRDLARQFGGSAKPSGAGGGDCAVALFPHPDDETAFARAAKEAGIQLIEVSVGSPAS